MANEIDPESIYCNQIAQCLTSLERNEEAIEWCEKALAIDPKYITAHQSKGFIFIKLKEYQKAI
jgi:tetratricopeptide (TPR) repeat protein